MKAALHLAGKTCKIFGPKRCARIVCSAVLVLQRFGSSTSAAYFPNEFVVEPVLVAASELLLSSSLCGDLRLTAE